MRFIDNDICFKKSNRVEGRHSVSDELIEEVIHNEISYITECVNSGEKKICVTHDFGYEVGLNHCVSCPPGTKGVYFARRYPRKYLSRMVRGIEPEATSLCTIVLKQSPNDDAFNIVSSWVGPVAKPELGDISHFETCDNPIEAIKESAEFWMYHALVEESELSEF